MNIKPTQSVPRSKVISKNKDPRSKEVPLAPADGEGQGLPRNYGCSDLRKLRFKS